MSSYTLPSLQDIIKAHRLISNKISSTPLRVSHKLSDIATSNLKNTLGDAYNGTSVELCFKCENLQTTGSFKFRGATNFLSKLEDEELERGLLRNHALAVSHVAQIISQARNLRIPTTVVLPSNCSVINVQAPKRYGATVVLAEPVLGANVRLAEEIVRQTGARLVPPADHVNVVLGQATAVREFVGQVRQFFRKVVGDGEETGLDAVIVPSGGGGLLVGAIAACKNGIQEKGIALFGAEPAVGGPGLSVALRDRRLVAGAERVIKNDAEAAVPASGIELVFQNDGHVVRVQKCSVFGSEVAQRKQDKMQPPTIAEGLRTATGKSNWEHIKREGNIDDVFAVGEEHIKEALRLCIEQLKMVVEPSAAVALAAVLFNTAFHGHVATLGRGRRVKIGIVLTGRNVSREKLRRILPALNFDGV